MVACITGASSGIGQATAIRLATMGYSLILCGRRADRLETLASGLSVPSHCLLFDVGNAVAVKQAFASLPEAFKKIDVLINNAGNAHGLEPIQSGDLKDWQAMMDSNVMGLLQVTQCILPMMLPQQKGHIINISSVAGKTVYPNGAVYCASKAAVEALSTGMRLDLTSQGIKVSNIAPGAVETEFSSVRFKGDEDRAKAVYQGFDPLQAEDIADAIAYVLQVPAHVTIADMVILAGAQASATQIHRKS